MFEKPFSNGKGFYLLSFRGADREKLTKVKTQLLLSPYALTKNNGALSVFI